MKRKVLAMLVPALLVAGAANAAEVYNKDGNKLDLYGKVAGLHYFSDDAGSDGDMSYARIGFKGETQIADQFTGYGQWEFNIGANGPESDKGNTATRLAFAGLGFGQNGTFDYGRNYGVVYDIEAWTIMLPELDGNGRKLAKENGDGFGMSTSYDFDFGLSLGAAYSNSDRTDNQVHKGTHNTRYGDRFDATAGGETAEAWTVGAKYDANNVYLAAMYAETRNMTGYGDADAIANKTQNFEVVAQYQFDFGLRPSIAYLQSKGKDLGGVNSDNFDSQGNHHYTNKDLVKYVDIGMTYYFNKNISTYVDYKINLLDNDDDFYKENGIATDDIVAVGLVYQF